MNPNGPSMDAHGPMDWDGRAGRAGGRDGNSAEKQSGRPSINRHYSVIVTVRGQIGGIASTVHVLALVT